MLQNIYTLLVGARQRDEVIDNDAKAYEIKLIEFVFLLYALTTE